MITEAVLLKLYLKTTSSTQINHFKSQSPLGLIRASIEDMSPFTTQEFFEDLAGENAWFGYDEVDTNKKHPLHSAYLMWKEQKEDEKDEKDAWFGDENSDEDSEEEVRCYCEKCDGEGKCLVSKKRAKQLDGEAELECPFGDECTGENDDSDDDDSD